jgi:hypothetical protein
MLMKSSVAHGLEYRDLVLRAAARREPGQDLADLGSDVVLGDEALAERDEDVAGLFQASAAFVDEKCGPADGLAGELADVRLVGPDGIDVDPGLQVAVAEDGNSRGRRGRNYVGIAQGRGGVLRFDLEAERGTHLRGESGRGARVDVDDEGLAKRTHGGDGLELRPALDARAEDGGHPGVLARQGVRCHARCRARPDGREAARLKDGQRRPPFGVHDDSDGLGERQAPAGVVFAKGDELEADAARAGQIGGHDQGRRPCPRDLQTRPGRDEGPAGR